MLVDLGGLSLGGDGERRVTAWHWTTAASPPAGDGRIDVGDIIVVLRAAVGHQAVEREP